MSFVRVRMTIGLAALLLAVVTPLEAQITPALESAAREFDPRLRVSSDASLVQSGDFNDDGQRDVAAVVTDGDRSALIVFHGAGDGYRAHPLFTRLPPGPVALRVVPPGRRAIVGAQGVVKLDAPAVALVFPGRSSALYVWRDGRYQVYATEEY